MNSLSSTTLKVATATTCALALIAGGMSLSGFGKPTQSQQSSRIVASDFSQVAESAGVQDYENMSDYSPAKTGAEIAAELQLEQEDATEISDMSAEEFSNYIATSDLFEIVEGQNGEKLINAPYASKRIAVSAAAFEKMNTASFPEAVYEPLTDIYIMTFNTMRQTADAFEKIASQAGEGECMVDVKVKATASSYEGWGVSDLGLNTAVEQLNSYSGSSPMTVAVIDTGLRSTHKVFAGRTISDYSGTFISASSESDIKKGSYADDNGHGTHVAGIVASGTPKTVSIMSLKCLNAKGEGNFLDVYYALFYAANKGAKVVNLSLGAELGTGSSAKRTMLFFDGGLKAIDDVGGLVVVAAGNESHNIDRVGSYPAVSSYAVSVGALNSNGSLASYSDYGKSLDFVAPGTSIVSAYNTSDTIAARMSGTSMAAPHVAAVAADLMSLYPNKSNDAITSMMKESAVDLGTPGFDSYYGHGKPVVSLTIPSEESEPSSDNNTSQGQPTGNDEQQQSQQPTDDQQPANNDEQQQPQQPADDQQPANNDQQQPQQPADDQQPANNDQQQPQQPAEDQQPANNDQQQPQQPADDQQPANNDQQQQPQQPADDQQPANNDQQQPQQPADDQQPANNDQQQPQQPADDQQPANNDQQQQPQQPADDQQPANNDEQQQPQQPANNDEQQQPQQPADDQQPQQPADNQQPQQPQNPDPNVGKINIANGSFVVRGWTSHYYYTGKAIKPAVKLYQKTVTYRGRIAHTTYKKLLQGIDYKVTYKNNVKVGKATVIVEGIGKYCGKGKLSFDIVKKKNKR